MTNPVDVFDDLFKKVVTVRRKEHDPHYLIDGDTIYVFVDSVSSNKEKTVNSDI